jgi:hypothetical protein
MLDVTETVMQEFAVARVHVVIFGFARFVPQDS